MTSVVRHLFDYRPKSMTDHIWYNRCTRHVLTRIYDFSLEGTSGTLFFIQDFLSNSSIFSNFSVSYSVVISIKIYSFLVMHSKEFKLLYPSSCSLIVYCYVVFNCVPTQQTLKLQACARVRGQRPTYATSQFFNIMSEHIA